MGQQGDFDMNMARIGIAGITALTIFSGAAREAVADTVPAKSGTVEEVTVTAQRRSENLQKSPVAISAFTPRTLDERQIANVRDAAAQIPGIMIQTTTGVSNAARIFLRGVGQDNAGLLFDPAVGVYVDGVYYPRIMGAFFDFFDIDRLEVLRGPQGTLYGRNTSGGAIKIETKRPTMDFTGAGDITYGSFNRLDLRGYVSGKLIDGVLAGSLSAISRERDGITTDPNYDRKLNNKDYQAVRGKLLFTPTAKFEATLGVDYIIDRSDPFVGSQITTLPGVVNPEATLNRDYFSSELRGRQEQKLVTYGVTLNAKYDLDPVTINSITGYRFMRSEVVIPIAYVATGVATGSSFDVHDDVFSQELNATYESRRVKGVVGAYYFKEDGRDFEYQFAPFSNRYRTNTAYAVYGQGSFEIIDNVNLIGGLRYTTETADYGQFFYTSTFLKTPQLGFSRKFSASTPKAGIEWQATPDILAYFTFTKGFKGGGWNALNPSAIFPNPLSYAPEKVNSYEAGVKFQGFNNRLRANVALFQADYTGMQLPVFVPGTLSSYTSNAAGAQVKGIEFEPTWYVTDSVQIYGNLAITDGKYTSAFPCTDAFNVLQDCSNRKPKGIIPTKYLIGVSFTPELAVPGQWRFNADLGHNDKYFNNVANSPLVATRDLNLVNLSVAYTTSDNHWTFSAEGKNVTDQRYYGTALQLGNAVSPSVTIYPNDPATWAFRVKYQF